MNSLILNILIILFLILQACGISDQKSSAEDLDADERFNFNEWIDSVTIPKHPNLISFEVLAANDQEYDKYYNQLPNSDSYIAPQASYADDTLIIDFFKIQWVGCKIIGNITVENDTVKLLFCNICSPHQESYVSEEALMHFRYKIKPSQLFKGITFMPEQRELKIK